MILLSPAKKIQSAKPSVPLALSKARFDDKRAYLVELLKARSQAELKALFGVSDAIAALNYERYRDFSASFDKDKEAAPAVFLFAGDAYKSLQADTLDAATLNYAQDHLRILSGLYGCLRPLDLIAPYRLEMGTKINQYMSGNLYDYWQDTLTQALADDIKKNQAKAVFNLASIEYAKAIDFKKLPVPVYDIAFKQRRDGALKTIGILAKRARGALSREILRHKVASREDLIGLTLEGYQYDSALSSTNNIVFVGD